MKAVGASALGSVAFVTPASACWEEVRFCGCGQLVVKVCEDLDLTNVTFTVTMFKEGKHGGVTTETVEGSSEPQFFRHVQKGNGKILALEISGSSHFDGVYCNPNTCAEKVRSREASVSLSCENDTTGVDVEKGHCGPPNDGNG